MEKSLFCWTREPPDLFLPSGKILLVRCAIAEMRGVGSNVKVKGIGTVEWPIVDVFGKVRTIRTEAVWVPQAHLRILSPQSYFQEHGSCGRIICDAVKAVLETPDGSVMEFPFHPCSNLPMMVVGQDNFTQGVDEFDMLNAHQHMESNVRNLRRQALAKENGLFCPQANPSVLDEWNKNISSAQKELLLWHQKLCHQDMRKVQRLMSGERPMIPTRHRRTKNPEILEGQTGKLQCVSCNLGKMKRQAPKTDVSRRTKDMAIRANDLKPGEGISIDQFQSTLPGRLPNTKGKEDEKDRFHGGTIMVDHASGFIFCQQPSFFEDW